MVYSLLGWDAPAFGRRICAGAIHPGELAARELVPSVLPSGLVLPYLSFLCWRCDLAGATLFHRCLASRMFISLAVVESELSRGSASHMGW
jgi:hypothetical protein